MDPISALGAALGSIILGAVKKFTGALDGKVGSIVKPFQPVAVLGAAVGIPYLTAALGIQAVDPTLFITAPVATILAVTAREALHRLKPAPVPLQQRTRRTDHQ